MRGELHDERLMVMAIKEAKEQQKTPEQVKK